MFGHVQIKNNLFIMIKPHQTPSVKSLVSSIILGALVFLSFACNELSQSRYVYEPITFEAEIDTIAKNFLWQDLIYADYPTQQFDNVVKVSVGESIQDAIDAVSQAGGGIVKLSAGEHIINEMITLKSNITIVGKGKDKTIIKQGPKLDQAALNAEAKPQIVDLLISNLTLKGTRKGRVNGILMKGRNESRHDRIMLQNVDVTDWACQGVHMKRTNNIIMDKCNIQYNGAGGGLFHNVYFLYNTNIVQNDCDMSFPVLGKGCKYTACTYVIAQRCTIRDCVGNGIQADHEQAGCFIFHKYHISGCGQVALWFPCEHYYDKFTYTEDPKYAPDHVVLNRCEIVDNTWGAMWRCVEKSMVLNCHFDNKKLDMGLLKCDMFIHESYFARGNRSFNSIEEWPEDVEVLW